MLLINNDDVMKVLDMGLTLEALDGVFHELVAGDAAGMGRIDLYVPSGQQSAPYYRWAVMAGGSRSDGLARPGRCRRVGKGRAKRARSPSRPGSDPGQKSLPQINGRRRYNSRP